MEDKKILSPKIDVVFKAVFGEIGSSERITKRFLKSILETEIQKINLDKNPILEKELKDEKLGILDILVEVNKNEKINLEMQVVDKKNIIERILFYWSKLYTRGFKEGQQYEELQKTVVILIADFEVKGLEKLEYHTKWKLIEEKDRKRILTDKLEIHIIELPKLEGREEEQGELLDWLFFINNPSSERVKRNMEENEELKEAVEKVCKVSEEEKMQYIAELKQKKIRDEKATYALGLERGEIKGEKIGEEKSKKEIAKKLLKMNMPIEQIAEVTELPIEEIQKLKEEK